MANSDIDQELQDALLKRALGYEYEEREAISGKDGAPPRVKATRKHVPPDIAAIRRAQELRELGLWKEIN